MEVDGRSVSVRLDGRASIEHQIDIHVQDLSVVSSGDFTLDEILQGLKYVAEYRINGGKMKNMDLSLMKKLVDGLLPHIDEKEGGLLNQRPTPEADLAMSIFLDFLAIDEFRLAVAEKNTVDLCEFLKIHRRCQSRSTLEQKQMAVKILGILVSIPQFSDWTELVKTDEVDEVEKVIKEYSELFNASHLEPTNDHLYPPAALYFDKNVQKLAEMFKTSIENGLTSDQVIEYSKVYGPNKLPSPPQTSVLKMLYNQITDFMILVLLIVGAVECGTGDYDAGIILFAVVVINVVIGFWQEFQASRAIEALMSLTVPKATVMRDGKQSTLDSCELVPGDIVLLEEGDAVPADLRLAQVAQLEIEESILTGESLAVTKSIRTIRKKTRRLPLADCKGNAFMSTVVSKGRGRGIVVRTGENSEVGRISKAIVQQPPQKTPIQKKLDRLGKILVALALLLCLIVFVVGSSWKGWQKDEVIKMVLSSISLAVSVIPEGLVVVVTITMAIAVKRMATKNAIVRKIPSVETLGSVTVICSDKTGTLTEGKMGASELWTSDYSRYFFTESTSLVPTAGACMKITSSSSDPKPITAADRQGATLANKETSGLAMSCLIASMCNNSTVSLKDQEWISIGDPTEVAMLVAAQKTGLGKSHWQQSFTKIGEYAFDSERKMMSVLVKNSEFAFCLSKGAPEAILSRCVGFLSASSTLENFTMEPINDAFNAFISKQASAMAESGLRVLALAAKKITIQESEAIISSKKASSAESELVIVGLIGLIDPPKQGVADSIGSCVKAGIKVIMITGDHIATATSIAKQIGIIDPSDTERSVSMRGFEVDMLTESQLADLKPFPVVFARVSPDNKLKIVQALQSKGNSVCMTGDGVNDAAAVKKADVGVAMGLGGTEITKQAADIVLADDNFVSIVHAVKEGRRVFDNIQKFLVYLLSCNSAEIFLFLLTTFCNLDLPFSIKQVLWANIIADIPPATSLGLEPYELDIMDRLPRPPTEGVLPLRLVVMVFLQGLLMSFLSFLVFIFSQGPQNERYLINGAFLNPTHPTLYSQRTLCFFVLTMMQLFQSFLSRSVSLSIWKTGLLGNKWCVYAFLLSFGLLLLGIYTPGLNQFLDLQPLHPTDWAVAAVCIVIQFVVVEMLKLLLTARKKYKRVVAEY